MKIPTLKDYRANSELKHLKGVRASGLTDYLEGQPLDDVINNMVGLREELSKDYKNLRIDIREEYEYYGESYTVTEILGDRIEHDYEFKRRTSREWQFLKSSIGDYETSHKANIIKNVLSDCEDLKDDKYKKSTGDFYRDRFRGHCYIASEALYHLMGGKKHGWKPMFIKHEEQPHWFISHDEWGVVDVTCEQFKTGVSYKKAVGKDFLTKEPSKRAQILIERMVEFYGKHPYA